MVEQNRHLSLPGLTTFVLGAGFSKYAAQPLQVELSRLLLSEEFDGPINRVITRALKEFLRDVFGWREGRELPSLEDVFTCIDLSAESGHNLGIKYTPRMLRALRRMAIYRTCAVLDRQFTYSEDIDRLLRSFCLPLRAHPPCRFLVLNWDIVLEKHLLRLDPAMSFDYGCPCYDWNAPNTPMPRAGIPVCKMHGSANWVYCDNCRSLFFDLNEKLSLRTWAGLVRSDFRFFDEHLSDREFDAALGMADADRECRFCGNVVSSHVATFSYRKSFRTPAYSSIWYHAEKLLADSEHWIFIGYSLPEADYQLKHLLKTAQLQMSHRHPHRRKQIEVVVGGDEATRRRFEGFFGSEMLRFYDGGLSEYVAQVCGRSDGFPAAA